ncbi:hypothetical protein A2153_04190 [Candidatus Gottesmanbacteria bacterium RBG_16_38_7b]|uniref:Uncharacterized protein n=1 Tax=Candidatus Gottesmanbacteria bacterium RBG_16_38_7b TaxID=1798372 RepID=A0A1F5YES0_9BACT|nr:MAG: hypothetical protein A2153_04190 [Candidatus Gottesmanbacteria bacterium RBG_16_38_7b]
MNKQKIFVPILIVIVIIILIVSYNILFRLEKRISNKQENNVIPTVTRMPITPGFEADYDESILEELNTAPKAEYKYTLSTGEEVTIKIPRGVDPPPLSVVERMYQRRR